MNHYIQRLASRALPQKPGGGGHIHGQLTTEIALKPLIAKEELRGVTTKQRYPDTSVFFTK
jgi:hypothetical protein